MTELLTIVHSSRAEKTKWHGLLCLGFLFVYLLGINLASAQNAFVEPQGFVRIKAGSFQMGSNEGEKDEQPVHTVVISLPFDLLDHEVTVAEYRVFTEDTSYQYPLRCMDGISNWGEADDSTFQKNDFPVNCVSWSDAKAYIQWLNDQHAGAGFGQARMVGQSKEMYRLPTEAEWEYAARAGSNTAYACGNDAGCLDEHAWYLTNAKYDSHAVKSQQPNAWKLYDMHGNLSEWVRDQYGYYSSDLHPQTDPQGPMRSFVHAYETLYHRVYRGGKWAAFPPSLRAAKREHARLDYKSNYLGFRIVRNIDLGE